MLHSDFYRVVCANECRNTHHKLVMNSLQHLTCRHADRWRTIYLRYFEYYLQGSKDPDSTFKDFRNHVLHVSDNFWGGPVKQANRWYVATVEHLKNQRWKAAVYASGVLSHYYMDPIMPLHTGQTEEEGVIHRACEWSINKSFGQLIEQLESGSGYPNVDLPSGQDWLKEAIHQGAIVAHDHYQDFLDHYNFEVGSRDPLGGLDAHLKNVTSSLLGYASIGFARILERAFAESGATPDVNRISLMNLYYQLTLPVSWIYKGYQHLVNGRSINRIAQEFQRTGKVVRQLPADEKVVRESHAKEILQIDLKDLDAQSIQPLGTKSTVQAKKRNKRSRSPKRVRNRSSRLNRSLTFRLNVDEPLANAPSIGEKTASRFQAVGIETVQQFLSCDSESTAAQLDVSHIQSETIHQWQTQATLACRIPEIYGHDAQILVACGFEDPEEIAACDPETILSLVSEFLKTTEAKFIIRNGSPPDLEEVTIGSIGPNRIDRWNRCPKRLDSAR